MAYLLNIAAAHKSNNIILESLAKIHLSVQLSGQLPGFVVLVVLTVLVIDHNSSCWQTVSTSEVSNSYVFSS